MQMKCPAKLDASHSCRSWNQEYKSATQSLHSVGTMKNYRWDPKKSLNYKTKTSPNKKTLHMKTRIILYAAACMLMPVISFCQLQKADNDDFTYRINIPNRFPPKIFSDSLRATMESATLRDSSTFVFIEFGDGTFASGNSGINTRKVKHYYATDPAFPTVMFLSAVYDTSIRPHPTFFAKSFSGVRSSLAANPPVLQGADLLAVTPSVSDSLLFLRDSTCTFAITYKLAAGQALPVKLVVSYGDDTHNAFTAIGSEAQLITSTAEYSTSPTAASSTINQIRMYNSARINNAGDVNAGSRKITFTIDNAALADGNEHSIFITLKLNGAIDINTNNSPVNITATLKEPGVGGNIIASESLPMGILSDDKFHDPNKLIAKFDSLKFRGTDDFKRSNITQGYTLHVENSGEGFVNDIAARVFIPYGFMTPSYRDVYRKPSLSTEPPVSASAGRKKKSKKKKKTNSATASDNVVFHSGDLLLATADVRKQLDRRIKIDSISVHGVHLLAAPFYITQEDTVFILPLANSVSNVIVTAKFSHPFLEVTIKNTTESGANPLLYGYQPEKKYATAEIKFSLQTARVGPNRMMSWASVVFNKAEEYYTQPVLFYFTANGACDCIKEVIKMF